MTRATVLIPTHEHPQLLPFAIASARFQTELAIEIFVVCDGAGAETLEVARTEAKRDHRVRIFENPKGERHGEAHRHAALAVAAGEIVCYLSDDDLWLPEHVGRMLALMGGRAEFGFTRPVAIGVDGEAKDLDPPADERAMKKRLRAGRNFVPLSAVGHRLETYRRLRDGWGPAPADVYTDLFMWRKFVAAGATIAMHPDPTVCSFSTALRAANGWSMSQRVAEITAWWDRILAGPKEVRRALAAAVRSSP